MMDKIKDLQDLIVSRVNNALVGSFLISFLIMNSRGILIFIYSNNATKINIIKDWELSYTQDILIPLLFAAMYLTVIPLFSSFFKRYITNWIYEKEQIAERHRLLISHKDMLDVAVASVKSTQAYAEHFTNNEIQNWIDERESTLVKLAELKNSNEILRTDVERLTKSESELKASMLYYSVLYERCINSIAQLGLSIQALNITNPFAHKMRVNFGEKSNEYKGFIILQFADNIKTLFKIINSKPMATIEDWDPPIAESSIDAISLYLQIEAEKGVGVSQWAVTEITTEVKDIEKK